MEEAIQSSVYVASPDFAGWLMKRGFHWRKLWKKRWIALHGAEIIYMDQEPGPDNINSLKITKAKINPNSEVLEDDVEGNPNGFCLHINDGQVPTWQLRAESLREKKAWIIRLNYIIAIVKWLESFEKIRVLGVGGTGIVYELLHKSNGKRYALKEIEIKNQKQREMAISEAGMLKDIMENIAHPNILHIEKVFQVGSKFYLVFPLCTGGELYEHIVQRGHFTEFDAARITHDLIDGLYALHKNDILHLDIKPENLLFETSDDNAVIKITDFGISRIFSQKHFDENQTEAPLPSTPTTEFSYDLLKQRVIEYQKTKNINLNSIKGTIGYMSPEMILCNYSSKSADIFAAGIVVYILLCGRPPFPGDNDAIVLQNTIEGRMNVSNSRYRAISPDAKDLIHKMLKFNPLERITCEEILQHPWILQVCQHDERLHHLQHQQHNHKDIEGLTKQPSSESLNATSVSLARPVSPIPTLSTPSEPNSPETAPAASTSHHSMHALLNSQMSTSASMNKDLGETLKALSKHVSHMRSQKMATNLTRLMSYMRSSANSEKSFSLSEKFLKPKNSNDGTTELEAGKTSTTSSSSNKSMTSSLLSKGEGGAGGDNSKNGKVNDREEELMILLNKDLRDALSRVLLQLNRTIPAAVQLPTQKTDQTDVDGDGPPSTDIIDSKVLGLSIEQFLVILHHFHFTPSSSSKTITAAQRNNVAAIIFCRFLDRDNDGFITLDDILTAQAMILQRSESFLRMLFRMYSEILWYPGRQLNYMNLIKQLRNQPVINEQTVAGSPTSSQSVGSSSTSTTAPSSSTSSSTTNGKEGGGNAVLSASSEFLEDVVEPPKFITAKHISAIFEKLGYDANHGITVFNILSATAFRIKTAELQSQMKMGTLGGASGEGVLASNATSLKTTDDNNDDATMKITNDDIQLALDVQQQAKSGGVSTILMKEKEENRKRMMKDLEELLSSDQQQQQGGGKVDTSDLIKGAREGGGAGGEEDDDEYDEDRDSISSGASPDRSNNTSDKVNAGQIPAVMDVNDFIRGCRTDDILVQAILRKPRKHIKDLLKKAQEQALQCNGKQTVSYYLEKELLEAFQQSGIVIHTTSVTPAASSSSSTATVNTSQNPQGGNGNTSQKIAAVGKKMFGMASKAMTWLSNAMVDEEDEEEAKWK